MKVRIDKTLMFSFEPKVDPYGVVEVSEFDWARWEQATAAYRKAQAELMLLLFEQDRSELLIKEQGAGNLTTLDFNKINPPA